MEDFLMTKLALWIDKRSSIVTHSMVVAGSRKKWYIVSDRKST